MQQEQHPLWALELDVEAARSKLVTDLAILRSPRAMSAFADDVKQEALEVKDSLIEKAKSSAQSTFNDIVEDLKAKAAANPAATLAIGAGIAWRVLHHPPIATALVGLGLYSLLRTQGSRPADGDYLAQGRSRLKEQAAEFAAAAGETTVQAGEAVAEKASELVGAAKDKAREWSAEARQTAEHAMSSVKSGAQSIAENVMDTAKEKTREWTGGAQQAGPAMTLDAPSIADGVSRTAQIASRKVKDVAEQAYDGSQRMARSAVAAGEQALANPDSRDKLLLGVAGLAVAAALGIACQKRMTENV